MNAVRWYFAVVLSAVAFSTAPAQDRPLVLKFPGSDTAGRLRLEVTIQGRPPSEAWQPFLDAFFDYFDADADGSLSSAEVRRMFPLPLSKAKHAIDFVRLDVDKSGLSSRPEFRSYCIREGFGPVVASLAPPASDDLRLGSWWQQHLSDGIRDDTFRQRRDALMRRFDLNDDEYLDAAEILAAAERSKPSKEPEGLQLVHDDAGAAVLQIELEANAKPADLVRVQNREGWTLAYRPVRINPELRGLREFLQAQFENALENRDRLGKRDIEEDANLSALTTLFSFADRNGDDSLTAAELADYLKLIEQGIRSQLWIAIADRGRNPFSTLDADGDGRLSLNELSQLKGLAGPAGIARQILVTFTGPSGMTWGGVQLPAPSTRAATTASLATERLPWFVAMDRNKDGYLSPREFIGPPGVLQKLDRDGDGLISLEEARNAKR